MICGGAIADSNMDGIVGITAVPFFLVSCAGRWYNAGIRLK